MRKKFIGSLIVLAILLFVLFGWRIQIFLNITCLKLPDGYETVYRTKTQISDVYWLHMEGEKVIYCDMGYEAAKEYIQNNNPAFLLEYISVYPYGGMSDMAIYDSEFDEEFWKQPDKDNYVLIRFLRKL